MASLSLSQFHLPPRWNSKDPFLSSVSFVLFSAQNFQNGLMSSVTSRRRVAVSVAQEDAINGSAAKRKSTRTKSNSSGRGRKKVSEVEDNDALAGDDTSMLDAKEADQKPRRKSGKKASSASNTSEEEGKIVKKSRGRKKKTVEAASDRVSDAEDNIRNGENEKSVDKTEKKSKRVKARKKVNETEELDSDTEGSFVDLGSFSNDDYDTEHTEIKSSRRGRKKVNRTHTLDTEEASDFEDGAYSIHEDSDDDIDLELVKVGDDDISFTYGWPPLVCCFGAAQHAFVPSGRPANRLIDHEIHGRMKDALWSPDRYVRAPGGSVGNVAITLATLGGRVALMGKLGDDDFGQAMLYYLNVSKVQTRSVCMDSKRHTTMSKMKIVKRGGLRMSTVRASAENSLSKSEINIDVLKEAKMFYFNTFSLLDENMRRTTIQAIKTAKKLGNVIFYDVNLPLPLWHSKDETQEYIQQVWNLADIIEVTKQELEFLCGVKPSEKFDTEDNHPSKFLHYEPEVISPLWHEDLKVLFVTNGTSKIHYYTKEHDGSVLGMEDAPVTPFTMDMSASGDGIVAGLLRMLTVQPHLITDRKYLEHSIKYAISCGVTDQWLLARERGFPPLEGMDEEVVPDSDGIMSVTEREFRTVVPAAASAAT